MTTFFLLFRRLIRTRSNSTSRGDPHDRRTAALLLLCAFLLIPAALSAADTKKREDIAESAKWNLTEICPSDDAWRAEKERFVADIPKAAAFRGRLGESPKVAYEAASTITNMQKTLSRLFVYASMMADSDTRDAKYQAMKQEIGQVANEFSSATAWLEPETLKM